MHAPIASEFSSHLAIIGGSGFYSLSSPDDKAATQGASHETASCEVLTREIVTPYSAEPVTLFGEQVKDKRVWFIPRHGQAHSIAPHKINYRANLWALKQLGINKIIAVNAVGGIDQEMGPGKIVLPDQILDYTWGREHTYFDGTQLPEEKVFDNHIDFTWPYDKALIQAITEAAYKRGTGVMSPATYACVQGPRLETAAEILKLKADGASIVGMTGMPEAALARELGIDYACISLVVNWGAGLTNSPISLEEIKEVLSAGVDEIRQIIAATVDHL